MKFRLSKTDTFLLIAPLVCFGFAWINTHLDFVDRLEWRTLDWRTKFREKQNQASPHDSILVFGIGERSTLNIEPWPFRRSYHGQFQYLALHDKPRVWAWDVIFQNRVDRDGVPLDGEADGLFAVGTEELSKAGVPVVFAAVSSPDSTGEDMSQLGLTKPFTRVTGDPAAIPGDPEATLPFPGIRENGYFGMADAPRGAGGIVRHMPMVIRVGASIFPSLTLQIAMQYWGVDADDVRVVLGDGIYLGLSSDARRIPIDEFGRLLINYRYRKTEPGESTENRIPVVEYFDQLVGLDQYYNRGNTEIRRPVPMTDRVVLVGEFATDTGPSPFSDNSPLVLLQANVLNNVLQDDHVVRMPARFVWGTALLVGYAGLLWLRRRSVVLAVLFTLAAIGGYVALTFGAWIQSSLWIPFVGPLAGFVMLQFGFIAYRVVVEQSAKMQMRSMFGSYLSPVVINQMVESGKNPELGGIDAEITAYFSDIQSFSSFSEVLTPGQLVKLLNEYLTACTDIIQEQGGTLDKYIGDAVVAMFGAPVPLTDHAYKACLTSLLVQDRLNQLREEWKRAGDAWPELVHRMRTRIGLNTGHCMIGNMGSRTRFDYTMMGDNENLAARMESGAKSWGAYNMVTEATRSACADHGGDRIVFRPLGRIVVKGRTEPVPIHEIVGLRERVSDQTQECVERFTEGLDRYYARDWEGAAALFRKADSLEPMQPSTVAGVATNPSRVYQNIVADMAAGPPADDWNGVYIMKGK